MRFRNRVDAGQHLAQQLVQLHLESPVVFGLPRGGIPVAAEIAARLRAPLDVFVARKLGLPGHEEFGIGAVAEGLEDPVLSNVARTALSPERLELLVEDTQRELQRQADRYRGDRSLPEIADREVILVDDGLATGVTAEAALVALRRRRPGRLVLAVPVCAPESASRLTALADDVVCVQAPAEFSAVGQWYEDFPQTTDDEVARALKQRGIG